MPGSKNLFIPVAVTLITGIAHAQQPMIPNIQWNCSAAIPAEQPSSPVTGLAGAVIGVHQNILIVAGGSDFPGKKPWEGGKKAYYKQIYTLTLNGGEAQGQWKMQDARLPGPVAYSASASMEMGIVYAGGENEKGVTDQVFLLQWDQQKAVPVIRALAHLPGKRSNLAMVSIGKKIYAAGGENEQQAFADLMVLDLGAANPQWQVLAPMPKALSHCVAVSQQKGKETCIYMIGGRARTDSGISQLGGSVFCYHPLEDRWEQLPDIQEGGTKMNISAASAVPIGTEYILIAGSDDGVLFHQLETLNLELAHNTDSIQHQLLLEKKMGIILHHPGFNKSVYLYHTTTGSWEKCGELPYAPVTTTAVKWKEQIFIPCGEIRPGTRTFRILNGTITEQTKL